MRGFSTGAGTGATWYVGIYAFFSEGLKTGILKTGGGLIY